MTMNSQFFICSLIVIHTLYAIIRDIYSFRKSMLYPWITGFSFCPIRPPSNRKSATNDISFESPNTELSEFIKKLGVASSWRSPRPIY